MADPTPPVRNHDDQRQTNNVPNDSAHDAEPEQDSSVYNSSDNEPPYDSDHEYEYEYQGAADDPVSHLVVLDMTSRVKRRHRRHPPPKSPPPPARKRRTNRQRQGLDPVTDDDDANEEDDRDDDDASDHSPRSDKSPARIGNDPAGALNGDGDGHDARNDAPEIESYLDKERKRRHNVLQVLDFASAQPLISDQRRIYALTWARALGTDLLFSVPNTAEGESYRPQFLGTTRARLIAQPVRPRPRPDRNARPRSIWARAQEELAHAGDPLFDDQGMEDGDGTSAGEDRSTGDSSDSFDSEHWDFYTDEPTIAAPAPAAPATGERGEQSTLDPRIAALDTAAAAAPPKRKRTTPDDDDDDSTATRPRAAKIQRTPSSTGAPPSSPLKTHAVLPPRPHAQPPGPHEGRAAQLQSQRRDTLFGDFANADAPGRPHGVPRRLQPQIRVERARADADDDDGGRVERAPARAGDDDRGGGRAAGVDEHGGARDASADHGHSSGDDDDAGVAARFHFRAGRSARGAAAATAATGRNPSASPELVLPLDEGAGRVDPVAGNAIVMSGGRGP